MKVEIPTTDIKRMIVRIVGDYPLISGRYVQKDTPTGHTGTRVAQLPIPEGTDQERFTESVYTTKSGNFAFPAAAIKKSMVTAATNLKKAKTKGIDGKKALMTFFIEGEEFIPIITNELPTMRIGSAKNAQNQQVKTINAQYNNWEMTIQFRYNDTLTSPEQIIMMLAEAGRSVGIGVLRPETQGQLFGTFHVENAEIM